MDFEIDVAGGAVDGNEGVAFAPLQGREMLDVDMDEADGGVLEAADRGLVGLGALAEPMALETAVGSTAGDCGIDATLHHLGEVVERQLQIGSQFADEPLFKRGQLGRQSLGRVGRGRWYASASDEWWSR